MTPDRLSKFNFCTASNEFNLNIANVFCSPAAGRADNKPNLLLVMSLAGTNSQLQNLENLAALGNTPQQFHNTE